MKISEIRRQIYQEVFEFLENYKVRNIEILADKFSISGALLDELDEMFDFILDKNRLKICAIGEIDDELTGAKLLEVFEYNDDKSCYGMECVLYEDKEFIGRINGRYYKGNHYPKFWFLGLEC